MGIVTVLCFSYMGYIVSIKDDYTINTWARLEAEERMRRLELGLPVEVGESYSEKKYLKEKEQTRYEKVDGKVQLKQEVN